MNTVIEQSVMLAVTVDQLAQVKAQLAQLKAREDELKAMLIAAGQPAIEGTLHRASVSYSEGRVLIDWKTIAEKFNPSRQLISAHTSTGEPFYTVRVSARKGA